jgi:hypothetical protein
MRAGGDRRGVQGTSVLVGALKLCPVEGYPQGEAQISRVGSDASRRRVPRRHSPQE